MLRNLKSCQELALDMKMEWQEITKIIPKYFNKEIENLGKKKIIL